MLTTRAQASGALAQHINLTPMTEEESMLLLLRRAKHLLPTAKLSNLSLQSAIEARSISQLLGDLPLTLNQAGAYLEETGCSLADYLERYQLHRKALLNRRGSTHRDHPDSIAGTISLCMERLAQHNPAAVALLRCCAFLDRESITEIRARKPLRLIQGMNRRSFEGAWVGRILTPTDIGGLDEMPLCCYTMEYMF